MLVTVGWAKAKLVLEQLRSVMQLILLDGFIEVYNYIER